MRDARPLGINRGTGWAMAVGITLMLLVQMVIFGSYARELLLTLGGLCLLNVLVAFLLGRSGFYAADDDMLLVVNLLKVHRMKLAEIERLWPQTPYENYTLGISRWGTQSTNAYLTPIPKKGQRHPRRSPDIGPERSSGRIAQTGTAALGLPNTDRDDRRRCARICRIEVGWEFSVSLRPMR